MDIEYTEGTVMRVVRREAGNHNEHVFAFVQANGRDFFVPTNICKMYGFDESLEGRQIWFKHEEPRREGLDPFVISIMFEPPQIEEKTYADDEYDVEVVDYSLYTIISACDSLSNRMTDRQRQGLGPFVEQIRTCAQRISKELGNEQELADLGKGQRN